MKVAIVGAGAGGLVCARELMRVGAEPTVFEASEHLAGTWVYSDETGVHSSMYASLRTNLPTDLMAFRDYPFDSTGGGDDHWPRFVGHREVRTYLERFADKYDVRPRIQSSSRVEHVHRVRGGWNVTVQRKTGSKSTRRFDAVAVCTGHYHRPLWPEIEGLASFGGRVTHSHDYRRPEPFAGRTIALLGAKASGVDISGDLAPVASAVFLCARDHDHPPPRTGIQHRGEIVSIAGNTLRLRDGSSLRNVDDLLLCTGYAYDYPFFDRPTFVTLEPKWIHPLWLDVVAIRAPTLAFIGLPFQVVPFPLMEIQSRLFADLLTGRIALPHRSTLLDEHNVGLHRLVADGVDRRHLLRYGPRQFDYYNAIARRVGSPPLPAWFRPLYEATSAARRADPDGYREAVLPTPARVSATKA